MGEEKTKETVSLMIRPPHHLGAGVIIPQDLLIAIAQLAEIFHPVLAHPNAVAPALSLEHESSVAGPDLCDQIAFETHRIDPYPERIRVHGLLRPSALDHELMRAACPVNLVGPNAKHVLNGHFLFCKLLFDLRGRHHGFPFIMR